MNADDSSAFEYQSAEGARSELNENFRDAFEALKIRDYPEYLRQANTLANAFGVSRDTVGRWLNGSVEFVGKGDPKRIGSQADGINGKTAYQMRVAFAKSVILGQYLPQKVNIQSKTKEIKSTDPKAAGKDLRSYLKNDFTRSRSIRYTFGSGGGTWEYARYDHYQDDEESYDFDDWSGTVDWWNPGIDAEDSFPGAA